MLTERSDILFCTNRRLSSMHRPKQMADIVRIEALAVEASGALATAAVLEAHRGSTVEAAAEYALNKPAETVALIGQDLHMQWISDAITEIRTIVGKIDYKKIEVFRAASKSTRDLFEIPIGKINYSLKRQTSGLYSCVDKIFEQDKEHDYSAEMLDQIKNIK